MTRMPRALDQDLVELVHQGRVQRPRHVGRVLPDVGRLDDGDLRQELPQQCRPLGHHREGAAGDRLDHVARPAQLARKGLDLDPAAGFLDLLGSALGAQRRGIGSVPGRCPSAARRPVARAPMAADTHAAAAPAMKVRFVSFVMVSSIVAGVLTRGALAGLRSGSTRAGHGPGAAEDGAVTGQDHAALPRHRRRPARGRAHWQCRSPNAVTARAGSRASSASTMRMCSSITGTSRSSRRRVRSWRISRILMALTR